MIYDKSLRDPWKIWSTQCMSLESETIINFCWQLGDPDKLLTHQILISVYNTKYTSKGSKSEMDLFYKKTKVLILAVYIGIYDIPASLLVSHRTLRTKIK